MEVESVWWPRLRWRMRGAWQWPTFGVLTVADTVLIARLPFLGGGPDPLGAVLLAGFFNLAAVGIGAPLVGRVLRRRRPDLPRLVANDYAGTALLVLVTGALVWGGLAHRSTLAGERDDRRAVAAGARDFVAAQAPRLRGALPALDALRLEEDLYRACVPDADARRPLCLFVRTDRRPVAVRLDGSREPNSKFRLGGFR